MTALAEVMPTSTLSSGGHGYLDALQVSRTVVPIGFALVGGLTGASASAFPSELIDWTSADVIELVRPVSLPTHGTLAELEVDPTAADTPLKRRLDEIKSRSRLTWGQIADAIAVDTRAIHLWRAGGGISSAHHERLQELAALVDSIDTGNPIDVRAELIEASPTGSLLERLRAGESPHELKAAAPWRLTAREALERNAAEWQSDGVLDEDFVFLLYLQEDDAQAFVADARLLLETSSVTRREWETLLDAQFAGMEQPEPVAVEASDETESADDEFGIAPLFNPAELGISLGVGAIASRRPLHERN
jgi:hypothetical protein